MTEQRPLKMHMLEWPGRGLRAYKNSGGWYVHDVPEALSLDSQDSLDHDAWADARCVAIAGQRLTAMSLLARDRPGCIGIAYLDLPRLSLLPVTSEDLRLPTWLTVIEAHVSLAHQLLQARGKLAVQIDDEGAPYVSCILDQLLGPNSHCATVVWQKKYGPQNDLSDRIDDAHDFIYIYGKGLEERGSAVARTIAWDFRYAGKTEDATREVEHIRETAVLARQEIPKTSKPESLVQRLVENFAPPTGALLEVFSDTAFATAAAARMSRKGILLYGETPDELELYRSFSRERLKLVAQSGLLETQPFQTQPPAPVPLDLARSPVRIADGLIESRSRLASLLRLLQAVSPKSNEAFSVKDGIPSMAIASSTVETLVALRPVVKGTAAVVLLDFADATVSDALPAHVADTLRASTSLIRVGGFLSFLASEKTYALARLTADRVLPSHRYIGSIVLVPEDRGGETLFYVTYQTIGADPQKIGLPVNRTYLNEDNDPRGQWRDPGHKGARSGGPNLAFTYRYPPYRWELIRGTLPAGAWRISPQSGVIWAPRLTAVGEWVFVVRVTDSRGMSSERECRVVVKASGSTENESQVWWLTKPPSSTKGAPKITSQALPIAILGQPYAAVLSATGGQPYAGSTVPGRPLADGKRTRYWEFAWDTLVEAILSDDVLFGSDGMGKPRLKRRPDQSGKWSAVVELSWWNHDRLGDQSPGRRLARILSKDGDLLVTENKRESLALDAERRRRVTIADDDRKGDWVLGQPIGELNTDIRTVELNYDAPAFNRSLAWLEGYLSIGRQFQSLDPKDNPIEVYAGIGESDLAVILAPNQWPTMRLSSQISALLTVGVRHVTVYYYRGRPPRAVDCVSYRRIPFDLRCRPQY